MQVNPFPTSTLIAFIFALACTYVSGLLLFAMTGEVNRKLPEDQQFGYMLKYPGKIGRIRSEYKRLYPHGRIALYWDLSAVVMLISVVVVAWTMGFFH
jgi:hypothetical protein